MEFLTPGNPELAPLIGKTSENWSNYDNAMLQRVPFMVVMPGYEKGQIINTYGGQIDILPTLEHILGIESNSFLQVGQDLLSPDHQEIVAFRTANSFVTPKYTSMTDEPTILRAVLKSATLMNKLRLNWKLFVKQLVNS